MVMRTANVCLQNCSTITEGRQLPRHSFRAVVANCRPVLSRCSKVHMEDSANSTQRTPPPLRQRSILFRLGQIGLFLLVCLITCIGLFYGIENWRARHALKSYRADLERKGEHLGWEGVIPRPVPDERNLAMTPLLKPLLDYKRVNGRPEWQNSDEPAKAFKTLEKGPRLAGPEKPKLIDLQEWARFLQNSSGGTEGTSQSAASNILAGLSEFDAQFKELQEAIKTRPEGRWPVRYDENFACLLPHLAVLKSMVLGCTLRAAANLENHNPSAALEDATIGLALGDSIRTEPILISHLVRAAITSRKSTRLNSSHVSESRMPSSA